MKVVYPTLRFIASIAACVLAWQFVNHQFVLDDFHFFRREALMKLVILSFTFIGVAGSLAPPIYKLTHDFYWSLPLMTARACTVCLGTSTTAYLLVLAAGYFTYAHLDVRGYERIWQQSHSILIWFYIASCSQIVSNIIKLILLIEVPQAVARAKEEGANQTDLHPAAEE